jgi:hypothetical protein
MAGFQQGGVVWADLIDSCGRRQALGPSTEGGGCSGGGLRSLWANSLAVRTAGESS